jgi:hypothetical protein
MEENDNLDLKKTIIAFLMPTLIGKSLILYFGINYSDSPGQGYGIGLSLSIAFTVTMLVRFIWVNSRSPKGPQE